MDRSTFRYMSVTILILMLPDAGRAQSSDNEKALQALQQRVQRIGSDLDAQQSVLRPLVEGQEGTSRAIEKVRDVLRPLVEGQEETATQLERIMAIVRPVSEGQANQSRQLEELRDVVRRELESSRDSVAKLEAITKAIRPVVEANLKLLEQEQVNLASDIRSLDQRLRALEQAGAASNKDTVSSIERLAQIDRAANRISVATDAMFAQRVKPPETVMGVPTEIETHNIGGMRGKQGRSWVVLFAKVGAGRVPVSGRSVSVYFSLEEGGPRTPLGKFQSDENGRVDYEITIPSDRRVKRMFVYFEFTGDDTFRPTQANRRVGIKA